MTTQKTEQPKQTWPNLTLELSINSTSKDNTNCNDQK